MQQKFLQLMHSSSIPEASTGMSSALNTILLIITAIIGVFIVKTMSKQEVQQ